MTRQRQVSVMYVRLDSRLQADSTALLLLQQSCRTLLYLFRRYIFDVRVNPH